MKKPLIVIGAVVLVLVGARAALPSAVKWGVNRSLAKNQQVTGHIGDVRIAIWRGAYQIRDIELRDARHTDRGPFIAAKVVDFSVDMSELIRSRRLLAKSELIEPIINVARIPKQKKKEEAKQGASEVKRAVVPVDVSRVTVSSGTFYMPPLIAGGDAVKVDRVFLVGEHLFKKGRDVGEQARNTASVVGNARVPGNGRLDLDLHFDPAAKPASFTVKVKLEGLDLAALNPILKPETGIDLEKGTGNLYAEVATRDDRFEGYVKPILQDVEVHKNEKGESVGTRIKKKAVELTKNLVKNERKDSVATRIPLSGSLDDPKVGVWASIRMTLRHAYVHAIRPGLEGDASPEPSKSA